MLLIGPSIYLATSLPTSTWSTALDDMPTDFDPTVVLGDEWNMLHENKKDGIS
jgi:hypothetical protein